MKSKNIVIFIAAILLLIVAIFSLSENILTPYVPFKKAIENSGEYVQIIGHVDRKTPIEHSEGSFTFTLLEKDTNSSIKVFHEGAKPLNFEHAEQAVLIGKYESTRKMFIADKVLVKCPSKYKKEK